MAHDSIIHDHATDHLISKIQLQRQTMTRAKLHVICGNCGCNDRWQFTIDPQGEDRGEAQYPAVYLACGNCVTLHNLADHAVNRNPEQRLTILKELDNAQK